MSGHRLRKEKDCLNCGFEVNGRFCGHCGQENTAPRQPFYYLFTHFFEDLTHYDSQVWITFKYLLLSPGRLTKDFLAGKRMRYVPPVRLYIFMSFVAFLLPPLLFPGHEIKTVRLTPEQKEAQIKNLEKEKIKFGNEARKTDSIITSKQIERYNKTMDKAIKAIKTDEDFFRIFSSDKRAAIHTVEQLDSLQRTAPAKEKYNWLTYKFIKKDLELEEQGVNKKMVIKKLNETVFHNLPKALFLYLPLFALWLWIFHNKKKWWYFDHGVFTLHYFSLLLCLISILYFIVFLTALAGNDVSDAIAGWSIFIAIIYAFFYFFRSHSNVYQERKRRSRFKGILLFFVNIIFMTFFGALLYAVSFLTLH